MARGVEADRGMHFGVSSRKSGETFRDTDALERDGAREVLETSKQ